MHFQTLLPAQKTGAPSGAAPNRDTSNDRSSMLRRLILDPWMAVIIALAVMFTIVPGLQWLASNTRSLVTDYFSTMVLLFLSIGAVLHSAKGIESDRERYFWRLLGLSLSAWLAGEALAYLYLDNSNASAGTGVDALYLLLYLGLVLALDLQPESADGRLRIRPLRVLSTAGRILFVGGLFAYFVLLPRTLGVNEYLTWIPSFSLYVILDLYLFGRLVYVSIQARTPRWRLIYVLLTIAWAFVLATDSIDFAWVTSYLSANFPGAADICWYVPMILFVGASRIAHLTRDTTKYSDANTDTDADDDDRIRGIPLLVYSLGFALVHLSLSAVQPDYGSLQNARIGLVMLCLVVFGILNLVQNSIVDRRSREQSLRRKEAERHIRSLSLSDPLTQLLNRRAFDAEFSRAVARAGRSGLVLGLMFIDLDHFKEVNDTYGHTAGDSILREAAARIKAFTREVDTLARYGGDEFVIVLEGLESPSDAEIVAGRILDGFRMGFQYESVRIELSASIGIAIYPGDGRTPSQLFEAADRAMYCVKESGGSATQVA
jgi:diguanylate cyclase (GGDEF)-like protein